MHKINKITFVATTAAGECAFGLLEQNKRSLFFLSYLSNANSSESFLIVTLNRHS